MKFSRPHHQLIGMLLRALNTQLLREHHCFFAGGTALALRFGEFRESVDVDFLVSDRASYRDLRLLCSQAGGVAALLRPDAVPLFDYGELRADQYGIRTQVVVAGTAIKFEIVLEGRIDLDVPDNSQEIMGVSTLTLEDAGACKLLANSDRGADAATQCRDIIDLSMMELSTSQLRAALQKAETAYGPAILRDFDRVMSRLQRNPTLLPQCMTAMKMTLPEALLWDRLRRLRSRLERL